MKPVMRITGVWLLGLCLSLLLASCANLRPGFEQPQVNITSFTLVPASQGATPRFRIGLQVINPNRTGLSLQGMNYSVEVEGHRLLSGASADMPAVPAYGMAEFHIEASPDLLGSARLFSDLMSGPRDGLNYTFKARLDLGGLWPYVQVEESGQFQMPAAR